MIKYSQIKELTSKLSFKCDEYNLETDEEIDIPYSAYIRYDGDSIYADGINLLNFLYVRIILIDSEVNSIQQQEIKDLLESNEISYSFNYSFDEEHRIHTTSFTFEVIDG